MRPLLLQILMQKFSNNICFQSKSWSFSNDLYLRFKVLLHNDSRLGWTPWLHLEHRGVLCWVHTSQEIHVGNWIPHNHALCWCIRLHTEPWNVYSQLRWCLRFGGCLSFAQTNVIVFVLEYYEIIFIINNLMTRVNWSEFMCRFTVQLEPCSLAL